MMRTAESVAVGHPDKMCDQVSDAILDACLKQDPASRVAIECMGGHGLFVVMGEITTTADFSIDDVVRRVLRPLGVPAETRIEVNVVKQSPQIAQGVDTGGAGDQGIMVGYACAETPELMPLEVMAARELTRAMGDLDGKSQVTVDCGRITTVVTSVCNGDQALHDSLADIIQGWQAKYGADILWHENPAGEWTVGGFNADTGLTGRKLAVDAYGPRVATGGGAFSGKDATKVDRSAAYMARHIACDFVRNGAKEATVSLAYAIGVAEPVMATAVVDGAEVPVTGYDLTPQGIIKALCLTQPAFEATARQGHFGNGNLWD